VIVHQQRMNYMYSENDNAIFNPFLSVVAHINPKTVKIIGHEVTVEKNQKIKKMSLLDAIVTPRKPSNEMTENQFQVNTLCLKDVPTRFKERILSCVNQQLEALGSLSSHVGAQHAANMNEILEVVIQQEEQRVMSKIEKINKIRENYDEAVSKFTASFEELESATVALDKSIDELVTQTVSDIFRKEVAKAVSYQIQHEMSELVEENVTVERKLHRVTELCSEIEQVMEGSQEMAKLYARGEAAYNGLYALGEGFEMYSKEELSNFMGSSFLEWLRSEKFSAKYEDMKGLVSDWESLLSRELAVRASTSKTLENIMQSDNDQSDQEDISSSSKLVLLKNTEDSKLSDEMDVDKSEKENKSCASTKRFSL
jgi:DNA-directed RNA polymerase subunit L